MNRSTVFFVGMWLAASLSGLGALWFYANRPGPAAQSSSQWPPSALVTLDSRLPTLVLFIHPKCACTRATLDELNWILTREGHGVAAHALFFRPAAADVGWERTDLWNTATALGLQVRKDPDGAQARLFGARTSGTLVLYAPSGRLLYRGGITSARGHEGDNLGRRAVMDAIQGRPALDHGPVFGCLLSAALPQGESEWTKKL